MQLSEEGQLRTRTMPFAITHCKRKLTGKLTADSIVATINYIKNKLIQQYETNGDFDFHNFVSFVGDATKGLGGVTTRSFFVSFFSCFQPNGTRKKTQKMIELLHLLTLWFLQWRRITI